MFNWQMIGQFNRTFDQSQRQVIIESIQRGLKSQQIDIFAKTINSADKMSVISVMIQNSMPDQLIEIALNPELDYKEIKAISFFYKNQKMSIEDIKARVSMWLLERD